MLPVFKSKKGFTLIELLVVVAILSILLVIVLVAINPARQTRDARNTKRRADVLTILNAVNQYFVDNGDFPTGTPDAGDPAVTVAASTPNGTAFCQALVPTYVAQLPVDPDGTVDATDCTAGFNTQYTISRSNDDRITVSAPQAENATISATR